MPVIQRMIRNKNFKYVHNSCDVDELYDMTNDPTELHNLITSPLHKETICELKSILSSEMKRTKDPYQYWFDSFPKDYI
jgi:arylsulfatase A-like enzyme